MIKYKVSLLLASIELVQVVRETPKYVIIQGRRTKFQEAKRDMYGGYYDTWDEAHDALLDYAVKKEKIAKDNLGKATILKNKIMALREND